MRIAINHVRHKYGKDTILKGISATLHDQQFVGLLGPNGAGKSTLMKIVSHQLIPTEGDIQWFDEENHELSAQERASVLGYVHQNSVLDDYLTVRENLVSRGAIKGLTTKETLARMAELTTDLEIDELAKQRYGTLSGGQKRRIDIASALLNRPRLLVLDEPTTGIDPEVRQRLWTALTNIRKQDHVAMILITHYLEEMADVDQLLVLLGGQLQFNGQPADFIKAYSQNQVQLWFKDVHSGKVEIRRVGYQSLAEKVAIINRAYQTKRLVDFKDEPQSLELAYLNRLRQFEEDVCHD